MLILSFRRIDEMRLTFGSAGFQRGNADSVTYLDVQG